MNHFRNTLLATAFLFYLTCLLNGQQCGVQLEDQKQWMPKYLSHLNGNSLSSTDYKVPIVFHLVAKDNGAGRARIHTALETLCALNDLYATSGIIFYLDKDGINLIDHDGIFNESDFSINKIEMDAIRRDSALNVFVVNSFGASNVVGFYDSIYDWVILQKNAFNADNKTLAHEIGHFFTLLHPHFGWDAEAWNADIFGNPAPPNAPDGSPTERMDGSNCSEAGDHLCDTPPDYNFGIEWQQSCEYQGGALDPLGTLVDPNEKLIMSYFSDSCRAEFSPQQIQIIEEDIVDPDRAYLHPDFLNFSDPIENYASLLYPFGQIPISENTLEFSWEPVENAQSYYIEYDRSANFDLTPKGKLVNENSTAIMDDWLSDIDYYWRVFTWNESHFCINASPTENFSIESISGIGHFDLNNQIQLYQYNSRCFLDYNLTQSLDIQLDIFSISGRHCYSNSLLLLKGENRLELFLTNVSEGLYILSIRGEWKSNQLVYLK